MVGSLLLDQLRSNLKCHPRGPVQASLGWCCRNPIPAVWADLLTGINSNIPVTISVRVLRALIGLKGPEASTHTPIAHGLCLSPALSPQPLFELCCRHLPVVMLPQLCLVRYPVGFWTDFPA